MPTIVVAPLIFTGLLLTLWTYKCLMMIIFQNKIIYMPSIPPFSRSEKVEDYARQTRPVVWREHDLEAKDGVALKMLEGRIGPRCRGTRKHVAALYFQGNASSLPPRLPHLSSVLKSIQASAAAAAVVAQPDSNTTTQPKIETSYTIYALSYRGFWTSRGRASQAGIELDAQAALAWLSDNLKQEDRKEHGRGLETMKLVLWGQSIGAGVASTTAAAATTTTRGPATEPMSPHLPIEAIILETPFLSIRSMLATLYPQRFLPYRHLWPFLRSTWDSEAAIRKMAWIHQHHHQHQHQPPRKILILQAGNDELVPASQSEQLEGICRRCLGGTEVERVVVEGALHTEVMGKAKGRGAVVRCLMEVGAATVAAAED